MTTQTQPEQARLTPLVENGPNEKVANMLARLIGDDPRAATSALIILMGLQAYLDTGKPETVGVFWEPIITARKLKKDYGGQAYRKACEVLASFNEDQDNPSYHLYTDVCQILIQDPEQEKIPVDQK